MKKICLFVVFIFMLGCFNLLFVEDVSASFMSFGDIDSRTVGFTRAFAVGWDTVRDSVSASDSHDTNYYVGVWKSGASYCFGRSIFVFNTSDIPDGATITNVTVTIDVSENNGDKNDYYLVNADLVGVTTENADYNRSLWGESYGKTDITGTGYKEVYVSENLTTCINDTGFTMLYLVNQLDYEDDEAGSGGKDNMFIDHDHTSIGITFSGGSGAEPDYTGLCYVGDYSMDYGVYNDFDTYFLEYEYNEFFNGVVDTVEFLISNAQYTWNSDYENYYMCLNGNLYSSPSLESYTLNGFNCYKLIYTVNEAFTDEYLSFAFGNKRSGDWSRWEQTIVVVDEDSDQNNDDMVAMKFHNDYPMFMNGVYDGKAKYAFQLPVRFWYDCSEVDDIVYDFDSDTVFVSPAPNGTLGFNVGDTVSYFVYSNDMSVQPYIYINKDESNYAIITMTKRSYEGYLPVTDDGSYNVTLIRGGAFKDGVNFTVYPMDSSNYVYVSPKKTNPNSHVLIYYNYSSLNGYSGQIVVSSSSNYLNVYSRIRSYFLNPNTSGVKDLFLELEGTYYIYLCTEYATGELYLVDEDICYCYYGRENSLTVQDSNIPVKTYQTFDYSHKFVGWSVVIKINREVVGDVGSCSYGEFIYYEPSKRVCNATLELLTDEGYIILDYCTYSVGGAVEEDSDSGYMGLTVGQFNFIVGLIVMIMWLIMAILIVLRVRSESINTMVVALFLMIGLGTNIYFNLWDIWFGALVALVLVGVIILMIRKVTK